MRVLVTGGTGFVGSHAVKALVDAGHEPRLLVRAPERITRALAPHGVGTPDHVVGDVTDPVTVERALEGCDAVLHAANVFAWSVRRAREMLSVNPRSTEIVLGAAYRRGLDPIVHVSTTVALLPSGGRVLRPGAPLGAPPGAYARSKVAAERVARDLQAAGAPVTIVSPAGVLGPADPGSSEFIALGTDVLCNRVFLAPPGALLAVDVRDVAAVLAASFEAGRGPRHFLAAAGRLTLAEVIDTARRLTGRRLPAAPVPAAVALASGRAADLLQRAVPARLPVSFEGVWVLTRDARVDASATAEQLGISFRPPLESLSDMYRWLAAAGRVGARQAGRLTSEPPATLQQA